MKLNRQNKLIIGLCIAALILIAKLFSIQIIEDKYKMDAGRVHKGEDGRVQAEEQTNRLPIGSDDKTDAA